MLIFVMKKKKKARKRKKGVMPNAWLIRSKEGAHKHKGQT
jgi:ribosomal protein L14